MIKLVFGLTALALSATHAASQELPLTDRDRESIAEGIAKRGFHCPVVIGAVDEGEGPRGTIKRIKCQSSNGKQSWDIRVTKPPNEPATIEPW